MLSGVASAAIARGIAWTTIDRIITQAGDGPHADPGRAARHERRSDPALG